MVLLRLNFNKASKKVKRKAKCERRRHTNSQVSYCKWKKSFNFGSSYGPGGCWQGVLFIPH